VAALATAIYCFRRYSRIHYVPHHAACWMALQLFSQTDEQTLKSLSVVTPVLGRQSRGDKSQFAYGETETRASTTPSRPFDTIELCLRRESPKNGLWRLSAGDFQEFSGPQGRFRHPETFPNARKPAKCRLSRLIERTDRKPGLPGWGGSADRTGLLANSLQTGNFTGNFALIALRQSTRDQETAVSQTLTVQFPKK
jgi:hypothetical protein